MFDIFVQLGYREIPESTQSLKRILRNVVQAETEDKANSALDVLQVGLNIRSNYVFLYSAWAQAYTVPVH